MRQAMEDDVSAILSGVVGDVGQAVHRNINGAQHLHKLLSSPWLQALLKIYECLLQFKRLNSMPILPYSSGLSHEIMTAIQRVHRPSSEACELYSLLGSPHIQALLKAHDGVAQVDYGPVLPPVPSEMPEDEEAMRIVCLVKNNQPLNGGVRRGSVGDSEGLIRSRWSSLRRLTLEHLVPARRVRSGEELRGTESEARPLPVQRGPRSQPHLPRYESTGSSCLCPQTTSLWNQSAPTLTSPAPCHGSFPEKPINNRGGGASTSDDYAYLPPPVPAGYSFSLPNSPALYKKGARGGPSRNIPTPGRTTSCTGSLLRAQTAPSSPAAHRSTRNQGVSTLPTPKTGYQNECQQEPLKSPLICHSSTTPQNQQNNQRQPKPHQQPLELTKQCSLEELKSTVQTVASSFQHGTQDIHHLGQKMMAATEMITDSVEENAMALNLLAEVVEKLQGLIVASRKPESTPPRRSKHQTPPTPPPRVSSISPKVVKKPPTPYPRQLPPSSSSSSCSSSTTSLSSCADATFQKPKPMNGGSNRVPMSFQVPPRAGGSGSPGQVRLNNGSVSRAPLEDQQDCKRTGCLTTKKKKKNKCSTKQQKWTDVSLWTSSDFTSQIGEKGATIRRDEETGEIYIARVIHGGLADRSGLLHPGDLLVEVNGTPVVGLEPEQVIQILISSQGTILFKVIPNSAQSSSSGLKSLFMRAMVDYCPLQDPSFPCPDAGMAFSRGDLLEVVDQSDGRWWQARKLPCTTHCAGLIPSASKLKSKQRELWWNQPSQVHTCIRPLTLIDPEDDPSQADEKHFIAEMEGEPAGEADSDITDGIYMAGFRRSFRLWRRTSYRRRRQSCTSCSPGSSSSSLSTPYEEVALYQRRPQENHRLLILMGASGVGVNELRRQIIKLNPSAFQGPIPHTSRPIRAGEQTGREYHFVTKELFEYMVCNHRFVEYGEHKGHLYGTSYDAIEEVLKRGLMCIVDVEPHIIQSLRTSKLKPYVIFIKAPSQESLRQTRRGARIVANYTLNRAFTEEDFVELEEASRLMEAKYKQFFNTILVNDDLQDTCMQLCSIIQEAQEDPQWIPVSWRTQE